MRRETKPIIRMKNTTASSCSRPTKRPSLFMNISRDSYFGQQAWRNVFAWDLNLMPPALNRFPAILCLRPGGNPGICRSGFYRALELRDFLIEQVNRGTLAGYIEYDSLVQDVPPGKCESRDTEKCNKKRQTYNSILP